MGEMAGIVPESTKRKGFEEYDDFSETSLSQPATKIRRLDAEFPTSMEGQQMFGCVPVEKVSEAEIINVAPTVGLIGSTPLLTPTSNERALVLYKPVYPSLSINQELVTDLKNLAFWPENCNALREIFGKDNQSSSIDCLAMIPWVPFQAYPTPPGVESSTTGAEPMEEEMDGTSMEVEEEGFRSLKQYCMMSEMPQTTASTPITW